jgi:hypothetical protein
LTEQNKERPWEMVFLVAQHDGPGWQPPYILEREAYHLPEHKCWNVNVREPGCRTRSIQSVPEEKVYRTREVAEHRLQEVLREKGG